MSFNLQAVHHRISIAVSLLLFLWGSAAVHAETQVAWLSKPVVDSYPAPDVVPAADVLSESLRLSVTPGEYEPASFMVRSDQPVKNLLPVAGVLSDGESELADSIDIRIVKHWYQASRDSMRGNLSPILVPELLLKDDGLVRVEDGKNFLRLNGKYRNMSRRIDQGARLQPKVKDFPVQDAATLQPVDLAEGETRQFWVTVHVPATTQPGIYSGFITLSAEGVADRQLPLELEVLPFTLAPSMLTYSIFHRAYIDPIRKDGSVSSEVRSQAQYAAELENLVAHGVTKPNLYQPAASPLLDKAIELREAAGVDHSELFFIGLEAVPGEKTPVPGGFESRVRSAQRALAKYDINDVYAWGRDEARGDRLTQQKAVWAKARELGLKVFSSGYHTTEVTGPGNFELMGDYQDLFVAINPVTRGESARWHGKNKRIFSYQNPTGGMERPETYRKNYGLHLWQMNYDGAMHYAYQDSFGNGWNDFDHSVYRDHNFVYPTVDGVIDTLQWEGAREGVDDVRYLTTLLAEINKAGETPLAVEAQNWLDTIHDAPPTRLDVDWARERMTGYILALRGVASSAPPAIDAGFQPGNSWQNAEIRWITAERSNGIVEYGFAADALSKQVSQGSLTREHRVELPHAELAAADTLFYRIRSGEQVSDISRILLKAKPQLQFELSGQLLSVSRESGSRSHAFVNWGNDLLGWWRFENVAGDEVADVSGSGAGVELEGDTTAVEGYVGRGVQMDGRGDYLAATDVETEAGTPVTIEGWFRFDEFALERGRRQDIFTGIYQHSINNHFYFQGTNTLFEVSSLLQLGTWHHIALTYGAVTKDAVIYIDGVAVPATAFADDDVIKPLDGFAVGRSSGFFGSLLSGADTQFAGAVDELRVWNRRLTHDEVQASYGSKAGQFESPVSGTGYRVVVLDANNNVVSESGEAAR